MAATTLGTVFDRICDVIEAQGFKRSISPFDFDKQPVGNQDAVYRLETFRVQTDGYFGRTQGELHRFEIWISRRSKRDPWACVRQLKVDLPLIEQALFDDAPAYDYHVADDSTEDDYQLPDDKSTYQTGRLIVVLDFDRST